MPKPTPGASCLPRHGERIKLARVRCGLSQEKLAEKAILALGTIQNAEKGNRISPRSHAKIVSALNEARPKGKPDDPVFCIEFPAEFIRNELEPADGDCLPATPQPLTQPASNAHLTALRAVNRYLFEQAAQARLRVGRITSERMLEELFMIDAEAYGPASITLDLFRNLWRVFPNGLVAIFEDDVIIGAFGIWPLTEKWAEGLRSGKLRELDLDPISMAKFRKCAARKWYISGVVLSPAARDRAIIMLLSDGLRLWRREAKLSFSCEFLALAWSDEGRALLKGFEFYPIREATETLDEMPLYQRLFEEEDDLIEMMRRRGLAIG